MPSLPSKIPSRRKHVTPIANLHENDVWQRTFNILGLEPLTPFPAPLDYPEMDPLTADEGTDTGSRKMTILDLPLEAQKEIFKHASSTDLIALSLVSKHFRELAAEQLYRNFHIVFPDEDDPSYESPIDGLAGGLDTLVTSEYNYARYVKEIVLDTLSGGAKGERAYRHYTYDMSCGKFMNTLFLLVLRKAHALEKLKWDLRVEISRPLFKALHQLRSLQHLHVRMHSGPSLYEVPPPLPSKACPTIVIEPQPSAYIYTSGHPTIFVPPPPAMPPSYHSYSSAQQKLKSKSKAKGKEVVAETAAKGPPTFAGFKSLRSLSVVDMDTLDYVSELKECIRNSASTLTSLQLSFSDSLARLARKPPPAADPDTESDQETEEFGNMVPPPPPPPMPSSADDPAGPAKAFRAQEEKKVQEAVLGRILNVHGLRSKRSDSIPKDSDSEDKENKKAKEDKQDPGKVFIKDLSMLSKKLMFSVNGSASNRTQQQKEALEMIEKAAKKYVEAQAQAEKEEKKSGEEPSTTGNSTAKPTPASSAASINGHVDEEAGSEDTAKAPEDEGPLMIFGVARSEKGKLKQSNQKGPQPEDINIDEPEVAADPKDFEENISALEVQTEDNSLGVADATSPTSPTTANGAEANSQDCLKTQSKILLLKQNVSRLDHELELAKERVALLVEAKSMVDSQLDCVAVGEARYQQWQLQAQADLAAKELEKELAALGKHIESATVTGTDGMNDYVLETRGLALHTLALYLIPIKTSILSKAIDLSVLRTVTLLNVGPQAPFWKHLESKNMESPLQLQYIHTDNVTPQFLTLVNQLEVVKTLFLLERSTKIQEYSFAPKTTVTIDQIRKQVLKRHMGSLEILWVKNENDSTWDANEKTIKLICRRGKRLEELGISFGVRAVHTFNQFLPGLTALRAMHIIQFRNDDTCHWVVREIRKFAVDSVSHNRDMKLEYIALENSVERLVRRARRPKAGSKTAAKRDKGKGKEKEGDGIDGAGGGGGGESATPTPAPFPTLESLLLGSSPKSDSSDEEDGGDSDDGFGARPGLKLETLEGVRFYDVYGVTIFKKEIMLGRL